MFTRLVAESLRRNRRSKLVALAAIALGLTAATALVEVLVASGDRLAAEMGSYGANIEVVPRQGETFEASHLGEIRTIFWRHNIVAVAPLLDLLDGAHAHPVVGTVHRVLDRHHDAVVVPHRLVRPREPVGLGRQVDVEERLVGEREQLLQDAAQVRPEPVEVVVVAATPSPAQAEPQGLQPPTAAVSVWPWVLTLLVSTVALVALGALLMSSLTRPGRHERLPGGQHVAAAAPAGLRSVRAR